MPFSIIIGTIIYILLVCWKGETIHQGWAADWSFTVHSKRDGAFFTPQGNGGKTRYSFVALLNAWLFNLEGLVPLILSKVTITGVFLDDDLTRVWLV